MGNRRIVQAVTVAFLGIAGGGAVLILAWGPTVTPYRLLGFPGCVCLDRRGRVGRDLVWSRQALGPAEGPR